MKRYLIDLQLNTRDIGGYKTSDGRVTTEQRFIRSDVPQHLTPQGIDFFHQLGVTTVIDFRTDYIALKYPSVFERDERFTYRRFPIVEGSLAAPAKPEDSHLTYMKMLANFGTFKAIFDTIIAAPGAVFYHCTAGKDRTGVVTFLLLDLVGVAENVIIDDYAVSEQFINEGIEKVRAIHSDFPISLGYSKPEYFAQFIPLFRTTYGRSSDYLLRIGITLADLTILKERLLSVNG